MTLIATHSGFIPFCTPILATVCKALQQASVPPALPVTPWQVNSYPETVKQRKVELVVSANDAQALQTGIASQPDVLVLDFDDTFSPTASNVLQGHAHFRQLTQTYSGILMARPRPLFLPEAQVWYAGAPVSAGIFDVCSLWHSIPDQTLYLYLPKINTPQDAATWAAVLNILDPTANRIKVGIQIESISAAEHAEHILYVLRHWAFVLNAGRWDYFSSLAKQVSPILPERKNIHMGLNYLQAYAKILVQVAHAHGAQAIGGTAALVPQNPSIAQSVLADKQREAAMGFDGAWAGHVDWVTVVREAFAVQHPKPSHHVEPKELQDIPTPPSIELSAVTENIELCLRYVRAWVAGTGSMEFMGRQEDLATCEFARAQLWQWVQHQILLSDGSQLTPERYLKLSSDVATQVNFSAQHLDFLVLQSHSPDYLSRYLYPLLLQADSVESEVELCL